MIGEVVAVSRKPSHGIAKPNVDAICLIADHGVDGDAHFRQDGAASLAHCE